MHLTTQMVLTELQHKLYALVIEDFAGGACFLHPLKKAAAGNPDREYDELPRLMVGRDEAVEVSTMPNVKQLSDESVADELYQMGTGGRRFFVRL